MENTVLRKKSKNPFASQAVIDILNYRIEQEEYSARIYHAMSMWLNDKGYMGAAKAWQKDSDDEMGHAMWAKEYLLDMGVKPTIPALKQPPQEYEGLPDIIRQSYKHEIDVTTQCNQLASKATASGDYLLLQLSHKFMTEQQEELGRLQTLLDKLESFGEDKIALRLLDEELGE